MSFYDLEQLFGQLGGAFAASNSGPNTMLIGLLALAALIFMFFILRLSFNAAVVFVFFAQIALVTNGLLPAWTIIPPALAITWLLVRFILRFIG